MKKLFQPFHLVTESPWPLLMSFSIYMFFIIMINMFINFELKSIILLILSLMIMIAYQWWRDVVRESSFQGFHSKKVLNGLKLSMILFIISELFFFISIFWCYFHMFLSPSIEIGEDFPPLNVCPFYFEEIPLLNTVILLSSGVSVTLCHYSMLKKNFNMMIFSMILTIYLGLVFTYFQIQEYNESSFTISDSVYGSIFFLSTGFHGFHVLVGTIFLSINLIRMMKMEFSSYHHFGFEASAWYWHFVDVVWLFLFIFVYYLV